MLPEYEALRGKVDAFAAAVARRRPDELTCRAGCSACCHAHLELCDVEADALRAELGALDEGARAALARRLRERPPSDPRCALLDDEGRCAAYAARPLVCRTQGLPLRYPAGTVPAEAVRASAKGGRAPADVTWCPLNFRERPPAADDVLDAERVDQMLALVNQRATAEPLRRTAIRSLAEQAIGASGRDAR